MKLPSRFGVLAGAAIGVTLTRPVVLHAQAAGVLLRLDADAKATGGLRTFDTHPVDESELLVDTDGGAAKARLYEPRGVNHPPGLVMVHGVHHLGMDEPRLMRFARSMASTGIVVLTPDVRELADYTIDERGVRTIGAATATLSRRLPWVHGVGLMGLSFAGGLALLSADDPRYASHVAYVVAVGAHDDLARVSRFFATGRIERADGGTTEMRPHEYGPLVLVYAHAPDFFPPADVQEAREALRLWLWDEKPAARARAASVSGASRAKLEALFDGRIDTVSGELLADVETRGAEMTRVSPHGRLDHVRVPVFLLHGATDNVIPPTETLWLAHDLPSEARRSVLVTPLIGHVELEGRPSIADQWAAVHFVASILERARDPG